MSEATVLMPSAKSTSSSDRDKPAHPVTLIIRAVLLENLRRRDFYVVLILMGVFVLGAVIARLAGRDVSDPAQQAATAGLLLNLGLTLASLSAHAVALLSSARQMPDEMERRTIYPLLAKPLERGQLLAGKWAAGWLSGALTLIALLPLALLPVARVEDTSTLLFVQALLLQFASLAMLSALAILGSLLLPRAVNLVVLVLTVLAGGAAINMLRARAATESFAPLVRWLSGYLPDFSRLDLLLTYTSGGHPVGAVDFGLRLFHALVFVVFPLTLAVFLLKRRSI